MLFKVHGKMLDNTVLGLKMKKGLSQILEIKN